MSFRSCGGSSESGIEAVVPGRSWISCGQSMLAWLPPESVEKEKNYGVPNYLDDSGQFSVDKEPGSVIEGIDNFSRNIIIL